MESVSGKGEPKQPPYILQLEDRCRRWNSLPTEGGILDQPEALMQAIESARNARDAWSTNRQKRMLEDAANQDDR